MTAVDTLRGSADVASLGPTQMHEHVFALQPEVLLNFGFTRRFFAGAARGAGG